MLRHAVRFAAIALVAVVAGQAQRVISAKAGLVYFVLGHVSIAGSGRLPTGMVTRRLNAGEILFSEAGRAEVLLNSGTDPMLWNSGTVLRIGERSRMRMDSVELADTRVSIEAGSAVVTVNQLPKPDHVEVRIGGAVVVMKGAGVYRLDAGSPDTGDPRLRVFRGQAEVYRLSSPPRDGEDPLENGSGKTVVKRGQELRLPDLQAGRFNPKNADALQRWAEKRGTPPPPIPMPPMMCYSAPTNMATFTDWLTNCQKPEQRAGH
jgi:hypothetical protein